MNYHKLAIEILCKLHDGHYADLIQSIAINNPSTLVKAYNKTTGELIAVKRAYKTGNSGTDKVAAIKKYREQFGVSLMSAKKEVEKLIDDGEM